MLPASRTRPRASNRFNGGSNRQQNMPTRAGHWTRPDPNKTPSEVRGITEVSSPSATKVDANK